MKTIKRNEFVVGFKKNELHFWESPDGKLQVALKSPNGMTMADFPAEAADKTITCLALWSVNRGRKAPAKAKATLIKKTKPAAKQASPSAVVTPPIKRGPGRPPKIKPGITAGAQA